MEQKVWPRALSDTFRPPPMDGSFSPLTADTSDIRLTWNAARTLKCSTHVSQEDSDFNRSKIQLRGTLSELRRHWFRSRFISALHGRF